MNNRSVALNSYRVMERGVEEEGCENCQEEDEERKEGEVIEQSRTVLTKEKDHSKDEGEFVGTPHRG
jgi:hypothetical protein